MGMASSSDRMHGPIPPDPEPAHNFTHARFTGNMICADCGLLPMDDEDIWSDCNPEETDDE
jgi:hypothetical protein